MSILDLKSLGKTVSYQLLAGESTMSPDYFLLTKIFTQAKKNLKEGSRTKSSRRLTSPATRILQRRFSDAIARMQLKKTDFSYFVVDNLEKLLNAQYEHEEENKTSNWIRKLNVLDFSKRTREFFSELRRRHNVTQKAGSIVNSSGILSKNFHETLKNWTEYYKKLYFSSDPVAGFPTPDKITTPS